jgi:hypothetical protein
MTPEEMKVRLRELAKPLCEFMTEQRIASFLIGDVESLSKFDIGININPMPPCIKEVLKIRGSIYVIDDEVRRDE